MRRLALLAAAALVLPACGGHRAPAKDAAELVPASTSAYVVVAPNGLARTRSALTGFRAAGDAIPYLRAGRTARLDGGIVAFALPADEKAFAKRLDRLGEQHAKVRGWIVYARSKALVDAVKRSKRSLADTARYRRAAGALPADAIARAYVPRGGGWRAAALSVDGANAKLELHAPAPPGAREAPPTLAAELPAGAVVAVSGTRGAPPPGSQGLVTGLSRILGADVGALIAATRGPYVLYAVPGAPVPDVTFAAAGRSAVVARALRALAAALAGRPVPKGTSELDLGPVTLHYGPIAGQLVLSDADDPGAELLGGAKLLPSARFRAVADAAGLPEENEGFFFVDARRALAAATALSALANRLPPPAAQRALAGVRFLLDWQATSDGIHKTVYFRVS